MAKLEMTYQVTQLPRLLQNAPAVINVKSVSRFHQAPLCPKVEPRGFHTEDMTFTHPGRACLPAHIMYNPTLSRYTTMR